MRRPFQSPFERWLPIGVAGVGLIATAWFLWSEGYRRNEAMVWGWGGGSMAAGVLLYLWVRFADTRRVCKTCGVRVLASMTTCRKCGGTIDWRSVRPLASPAYSTIPGHKSFFAMQSGASLTALLLIPFGAAFVLVLLFAPGLTGLVVLAFIVAAIPAQVFVSRRKLVELESRLAASDGRLCTVCLYPRTANSDRCPECGVRETEVEVRALWERSGLWVREHSDEKAAP